MSDGTKIEWGGTPGPWKAIPDTRVIRKPLGSDYGYARCYETYLAGWNIESTGKNVVGIEGIVPGEYAEVDARAIAEVPAMVSLLRSITAADGVCDFDAFKEGRAILARIDVAAAGEHSAMPEGR